MLNDTFDYQQFLTTRISEIRPLKQFKALVNELDIKNQRAKIIQVAGTNGKGSTCSYISSILLSAGYNCGIFVSPSLYKINERIRINGIQASDQRLQSAAEKVYAAEQKLKIEFGGFARLCAAAMIIYSQADLDYIVLEAGLGGRIDPTNAFDSVLSVITSISLDHQDKLGDTVEAIAIEKSKIIKKGQIAAVIHSQDQSVNKILRDRCDEVSVKPIFLEDYLIETKFIGYGQQEFTLFSSGNAVTYNFETSLFGSYQKENASSAMLASRELGIDAVSIYKGIKSSAIAGRFELLVSETPGQNDILLDGAHNPGAFLKLYQAISDAFPNRSYIAILSIYENKDYEKMLSLVSAKNIELAFVVRVNERSADPQKLANLIRKKGVPVQVADSVESALEEAQAFCSTMEEKHPLIIAAGSLSLVGYLRTLLINNKDYYPYKKDAQMQMEVDFDY